MTTKEFKEIHEAKTNEELTKEVKSLTENWNALTEAYNEDSNDFSPTDKYCMIMQILAKRNNDPFFSIEE